MMRILSILIAVAGAAAGQTGVMRVIAGAADALGGRNRIFAVRTLVMEGSGIAPNIGQNPFPEGPLPTWWVREFKRSFDPANGRARTEQHRIAMFPFALATDVRQRLALDGDIAFNIDPEGRAQRAGTACS